MALTPKPAAYLGRHLLAEFYDCNSNVLNNPALIERLMKEAAEACGATIVQSCFHRFNPHGVSGVVVIAESHLTIHTWPENGYASVDLYTCGEACDPKVAFEYLREHLVSTHTCYTEIHRGLMSADGETLVPVSPLVIGEKEICQKPAKTPTPVASPVNAVAAATSQQAATTADVSGGR